MNASEFGKVAVLMGGWSVERKVSLDSGAMVCAGLLEAGIDAHTVDVGHDLAEVLPAQNYARAFNILHGKGGEDGTVQGLLEVLQIPYTGSDVLASALAMNKLLTKNVWQSYDLPMAEHCVIESVAKLPEIITKLGLPLILKPVSEGSSVGVSKINSLSELEQAVSEHQHLGVLMAEAYVDGDEYTIAILDGDVLPVIRLETNNVFYDYEAKYLTDETSYHIPCGLSITEEQEIQSLALRAFQVLGASGWGRVDLMRDKAGNNYLIELNTQPGMTDHSLVPKAAAAAGLSYSELVSSILATSFQEGELVMARQTKNRKGARRQQHRKGRDIVYSKLTLLLVFFKSVFVTSLLVAGLVYSVNLYRDLHQPQAQPFTQFQLEGEFKHLNRQLFQQRLESSIDGGYFSLDLEILKQQLELEPWVYRVELTRAWPDTLVIQIEEQQAIAFWGEADYLNQYGEQFPITGERIKQPLPFLNGTDGREKALIEAFVEYDSYFEKVGLQLKQISEDARQDQRLLLADGTLIALGRDHQVARVERFAGVYAGVLSDVANSIAALDLRYSHGFSVSWKETAAVRLDQENNLALGEKVNG